MKTMTALLLLLMPAAVLFNNDFKRAPQTTTVVTANLAQDSTGFQRSTSGIISMINTSDTLSLGPNTQRKGVLDIAISDAGTNNAPDFFSAKHITSGTSTTNYGLGMRIMLEAADGTYVDVARDQFRWTSASSKNSHRIWATTSSGTLSGKMRMSHGGDVIISNTTSADAAARLEVVNSADDEALIVRGHSSQTADLAIFETSAGTDVVNISNSGNLTIAGDNIFTAGTLDASSTMSGTNTFTTTATTDTTTISGAAATDRYFVTLTGAAAPSANDAFRVEVLSTGFVIHRAASGTSGLGYTWFRIKQ